MNQTTAPWNSITEISHVQYELGHYCPLANVTCKCNKDSRFLYSNISHPCFSFEVLVDTGESLTIYKPFALLLGIEK